MADKLNVLIKMRDEGHELEKFADLINTAKFGTAVQNTYVMLSEMETLDVLDLHHSIFQTALLLEYAKMVSI